MSGYTSKYIAGSVIFNPVKPRPGKYPVMFLHGMSGNARSFLTGGQFTARWTKRMALAGFSAFSVSMGDGFGAASESTEIENARIWAGTNMPWCDNSKLVLVGVSMGHMNALGYRRDFPARVAGILAIMGAVDLATARLNDNPAGVRAGSDAAWGVTYPAALPPAADFAAQVNALKGIPYRMYGSTADTVAVPAGAQAFAASMGGEWIAAGSQAHGDAIMQDVPEDPSIAFLRSCGA